MTALPVNQGDASGARYLLSGEDGRLYLVRRARGGDQAAMAALLEDTAGRLRSIAFSILRDRDLAEDATQQALIGIWRGLRALRDPERYDAWTWRLVANACHGELRRGRRPSPQTLTDAAIEPAYTAEIDLIAERDQLDRAFRLLPIGQRAVVALRHHHDLTVEGVAEVLQLPVGTVNSRLHRAMDGLRASLDATARLDDQGPAASSSDHANGAVDRKVRPWDPAAVKELLAGAGQVLVVSQDGADDATTISGALRTADDGDVILVRPGTYRESVVVDRDVAIVGDGAQDEIVIDFHDLPARARFEAPDSYCTVQTPFGFWLLRTRATIANLSVRGPNEAIAFVVDGGAPTIRQVRATLDGPWQGAGHLRHFLFVVGGARGRITDCTVTAHIHIEGGSCPTIEHNDLEAALAIFSPGTDPVVRSNSIIIRSRTRFCLGLGGGAAPLVEGNELSWVDGRAIHMYCSGTAAVIRDNVIRDSRIGISVVNGAGALIERNDVGATTHGIVVVNADPTVTGNTVRGLRTGGIVLAGGGRPTVAANTIDPSTVPGGPATVRDARPRPAAAPIGAARPVSRRRGTAAATHPP